MTASSYPPVRGKEFRLYFTINYNDGTIVLDPADLAARVVVNERGYDLNEVRVVDATIGTCLAVIPKTLTNTPMIAFHASCSDTDAVPYTERIHTAGQTLDKMTAYERNRRGWL